MVMRLIDYLKGKNITALFTQLIPRSGASQEVEVGASSLIDTWILLRNSPPGEQGGRHLSILKSRGMPHSSFPRVTFVGCFGKSDSSTAVDICCRCSLNTTAREAERSLASSPTGECRCFSMWRTSPVPSFCRGNFNPARSSSGAPEKAASSMSAGKMPGRLVWPPSNSGGAGTFSYRRQRRLNRRLERRRRASTAGERIKDGGNRPPSGGG
jgi:hypothetical protein